MEPQWIPVGACCRRATGLPSGSGGRRGATGRAAARLTTNPESDRREPATVRDQVIGSPQSLQDCNPFLRTTPIPGRCAAVVVTAVSPGAVSGVAS